MKGVSAVSMPLLRSKVDDITGLLAIWKKRIMKKITKDRNLKTTRNLQEGIPFGLDEMRKQHEDATLIKKVR